MESVQHESLCFNDELVLERDTKGSFFVVPMKRHLKKDDSLLSKLVEFSAVSFALGSQFAIFIDINGFCYVVNFPSLTVHQLPAINRARFVAAHNSKAVIATTFGVFWLDSSNASVCRLINTCSTVCEAQIDKDGALLLTENGCLTKWNRLSNSSSRLFDEKHILHIAAFAETIILSTDSALFEWNANHKLSLVCSGRFSKLWCGKLYRCALTNESTVLYWRNGESVSVLFRNAIMFPFPFYERKTHTSDKKKKTFSLAEKPISALQEEKNDYKRKPLGNIDDFESVSESVSESESEIVSETEHSEDFLRSLFHFDNSDSFIHKDANSSSLSRLSKTQTDFNTIPLDNSQEIHGDNSNTWEISTNKNELFVDHLNEQELLKQNSFENFAPNEPKEKTSKLKNDLAEVHGITKTSYRNAFGDQKDTFNNLSINEEESLNVNLTQDNKPSINIISSTDSHTRSLNDVESFQPYQTYSDFISPIDRISISARGVRSTKSLIEAKSLQWTNLTAQKNTLMEEYLKVISNVAKTEKEVFDLKQSFSKLQFRLNEKTKETQALIQSIAEMKTQLNDIETISCTYIKKERKLKQVLELRKEQLRKIKQISTRRKIQISKIENEIQSFAGTKNYNGKENSEKGKDLTENLLVYKKTKRKQPNHSLTLEDKEQNENYRQIQKSHHENKQQASNETNTTKKANEEEKLCNLQSENDIVK